MRDDTTPPGQAAYLKRRVSLFRNATDTAPLDHLRLDEALNKFSSPATVHEMDRGKGGSLQAGGTQPRHVRASLILKLYYSTVAAA